VSDVASRERPLGRSDRPLLSGYRILVVEDKDDSRDMLPLALESEGASVTDAASADELREMLASPPLDRMCVIAVTGRKELERELLKLGFWAVLIKPVTPVELGAYVLGCFERGR
jgi:PleD family two-component response regulator